MKIGLYNFHPMRIMLVPMVEKVILTIYYLTSKIKESAESVFLFEFVYVILYFVFLAKIKTIFLFARHVFPKISI